MTIAAPVEQVWQALTDPAEVIRWAAVDPVMLPEGYPTAGQHAIWRDGRTLLHDYIVAVEPNRRLTSRLTLGPWQVNEEYALQPRGSQTTRLRATWSGHPTLAVNDAAMRRLKAWCED